MLRGEALETYCKKANTITIGCEFEDKRVLCYGLYQNNISGSSEEIAECCKKCNAYIDNAIPLEEEGLLTEEEADDIKEWLVNGKN